MQHSKKSEQALRFVFAKSFDASFQNIRTRTRPRDYMLWNLALPNTSKCTATRLSIFSHLMISEHTVMQQLACMLLHNACDAI